MIQGDHSKKTDVGSGKTMCRPPSSKQWSQSRYTHTIFLHASRIFSALQHEPRKDDAYTYVQRKQAYMSRADQEIPHIDFESEDVRKLTYELVYSSLKYQFVIEDILSDTAFYSKYPEFTDVATLVIVILYDYLKRKFHRREPSSEEITYSDVSELEDAIIQSKVKLDAALARRRIKENAQAVEDLLPISVRIKDKLANKLLTYAWVNYNKTTMNKVINELREDGYEVLPESSRQLTGVYFCLDNIFDDTLVFSAEESHRLSQHRLIRSGHLVIQDKTSMFGPQSTISLLNLSEDVILLDSSSGLTSAHLASLMLHSKKSGRIYLCGIRSASHRQEVEQNVEKLGAANRVHVMTGTLDTIDLEDPCFKSTKVALIHAQCSKSAVMDPVGFVISEGEDITLLKDLSMGKINSGKLNEMARANIHAFRQVVKLPKVQAIIYVTRSVSESENEKIVQKSIELYNSSSQRKCAFRVVPPVFNFDIDMAKLSNNGNYYYHPASDQANGCFVCLVTREIETVKEVAAAVLSRATAAGLLADTEAGGDSLDAVVKVKKVKVKSSGKTRKKARKKTSIAFGAANTTTSSAK